jgi:hypothetical protein
MSDSATPKLKEFARRVLAYEAVSGTRTHGADSAAYLVCEKLREHLGKLIGIGGFRSLLSRALALAGAEVPWLRALQINADGSLEGVDGLDKKPGSRTLAEGEVALVSQLLGLLVTFIGPELTLRLLHDIWPDMDDFDL